MDVNRWRRTGFARPGIQRRQLRQTPAKIVNGERWAVNWNRRREDKSMDLLRRLGELAVLAAIICPLFWWFLVTLAEHGW